MLHFFSSLFRKHHADNDFSSLHDLYTQKIEEVLRGSKFSEVEKYIYAQLCQRQLGESYFAHLKRVKRLNALSNEDKQILINSEKEKLETEQNKKEEMLREYVHDTQVQTPVEQQEQVSSKAVQNTLSERLHPKQENIFKQLQQRQENEALFSYLKRVKKLRSLPFEQKRELINAYLQKESMEQERKELLLQEYLKPRSSENIEVQVAKQKKQVGSLIQRSNKSSGLTKKR